jgi:hypothetical protein
MLGIPLSIISEENRLRSLQKREIANVKKVANWSYKVKQGDENYDLRTDTTNDFMDFDSDQNLQIEFHY